jgi:hypothetical protein
MSNQCQNPGVSEGEWIDNIGDIFVKKATLRQVCEDCYQVFRKLAIDGKTLEVRGASGILDNLKSRKGQPSIFDLTQIMQMYRGRFQMKSQSASSVISVAEVG